MGERIHDDEADTSEATVRRLLAAECPQWATLPLEYLRTSGTDNAMWRAGAEVVVRLPRHAAAAARNHGEVELLGALATTTLPSIVRIPTLRHVGQASDGVYPHTWTVLEWLDGADAWTARDRVDDALAGPLAEVVLAIGALEGAPGPDRAEGERGGPLAPLITAFEQGLDDPRWNAAGLLDVGAVRRLLAEGLEVVGTEGRPRFLHGDLIPGNLLLDGTGRLTAVIDWGMAGWGDRAQDLAPAWAVLEGPGREAFRRAVGADDAEWIRARTIELIHAVVGALYYLPRRHPLGDVMARTIERILGDDERPRG